MENVTRWRKYLEKCYRIKLTRGFKEDVSDIYNYIQKDSIYYAMKTKNEIEKNAGFIFYAFYG